MEKNGKTLAKDEDPDVEMESSQNSARYVERILDLYFLVLWAEVDFQIEVLQKIGHDTKRQKIQHRFPRSGFGEVAWKWKEIFAVCRLNLTKMIIYFYNSIFLQRNLTSIIGKPIKFFRVLKFES